MGIAEEKKQRAWDLRSRGWTYERIGDALGIHSSTAWQAVHNKGTDPAPNKPKALRWTVSEAIRRYGSVYFEQGLSGGIICTVGETTGKEHQTVSTALRSAVTKALWEESDADT